MKVIEIDKIPKGELDPIEMDDYKNKRNLLWQKLHGNCKLQTDKGRCEWKPKKLGNDVYYEKCSAYRCPLIVEDED